MEKKNYQKRNVNNRSLRNNKPQTEDKERRYSKSKFRKDTMDATVKEVRNESTARVAVAPKRDYSVVNLPTKFQFEGKPTRIYTATLTAPTAQRYGYSVLSKGQMVRVEEFRNGWYRVTAQDGRQGIVYSKNNLKALQFS